MKIQETDTVFSAGNRWPDVSVIIPLYNYEKYICEALDSVAAQTVDEIGLVVVDDHSRDQSGAAVAEWMQSNAERFTQCLLVRNRANAGLSITRNTGTQLTASPFLFFLDADNHIYPRCLAMLREALSASDAAFAYTLLEVFDADCGVMGSEVFERDRLKYGNYIDAMVMLRKDRLLRYDGYREMKHGWEDYELWLRICEAGEFGLQVPEILGRYRVHAASMIRTVTSAEKNYIELRKTMLKLHPWIEI